MFGKPVELRTLHSIRSLSVETGLHPKRLRKLLKAAGALPADADTLVDGNCLFDAVQGSRAATAASAASMSVRKVGEYLNAPRVQRDMLYRSGLIVPRIRTADHGAADKFAAENLDAFLVKLLDGAELVEAASAGQVNIPDAANQACCTSEEIVRLILDRKLERKWCLTSERGYMSVLIDIQEVRPLVRGPDHGGFTAISLRDRMQTSDRVTRALMAYKHLKTVTVVNPVNRCPTVVVPADEVERFEREYVSLFALAKLQGRHHMVVKRELVAAGIEPALDPEKVGATFYRRGDSNQPSF